MDTNRTDNKQLNNTTSSGVRHNHHHA